VSRSRHRSWLRALLCVTAMLLGLDVWQVYELCSNSEATMGDYSKRPDGAGLTATGKHAQGTKP